MTVAAGLAPYASFLLDLDGCVWVGDEPTPGAVEAVAELRAGGRRVAFVTNDARHGEEDFVRKLWQLGFQASREEVVTVGGAIQHVLAESGHATALVVGTPALHRHVAEAGLRILNGSDLAERSDTVVLSGHERFDYAELRIATQAVLRGAELIGLSRDRTFPMPDGMWPGSGAVLAAVETATRRKADAIAGKPEPAMYEAARDRLGEGRILALGDRLDADVLGAKRAGFDSALVLTGATDRDQVDGATPSPTHVGDSLAALLLT